MKIEEHVELSRFTTLGTGGPARAFARPESLGELEELLRWARDHDTAVADNQAPQHNHRRLRSPRRAALS